MVNVKTCYAYFSELRFCLKAGSLLNEGAPYSDISENIFYVLRAKLKTDYTGMYEDLLADISYRLYCQYGTGEHSNQSKKIISSVLIDVELDQGN